MDSYLKTRSPVTFLSELRSKLQVGFQFIVPVPHQLLPGSWLFLSSANISMQALSITAPLPKICTYRIEILTMSWVPYLLNNLECPWYIGILVDFDGYVELLKTWVNLEKWSWCSTTGFDVVAVVEPARNEVQHPSDEQPRPTRWNTSHRFHSQAKGLTPSMSTIAHSSHMDICPKLGGRPWHWR